MSSKISPTVAPEKTFSITNAIFLLGVPVIAIALTPWAHQAGAITKATFIYAFIHYFLEGISITAGYHRLYAHRAYKANPIVRFLVLFFGAGAMQNSALMWAFDHRIHHRHEDTDNDPYNIKKGFFWAHMGWIFFASDSKWSEENAPADLKADKMVMFQHHYYLLVATIAWLGLPALVGWFYGNVLGFVVIGGLWRVLWTSHCTYLINSAAHVFGKATYSLKATARDNWFLAFFTFGEGYHNFHHKFQADYRNGLRWWQFDPTKWLIGTLNFFGWASDLNRTPEEKILLAQMKAQQQSLEEKGINTETLKPLTEKMETLIEEFRSLKQKAEQAAKAAGNDMIDHLKHQLEEYKKQRTAVYQQWMKQFQLLQLA